MKDMEMGERRANKRGGEGEMKGGNERYGDGRK